MSIQTDAADKAPDPGTTGSGRDGDQTTGRGRAVTALGFSQAVDNSESGLIQTFFPLIRTAFNLDYGALGILTSISKFARMIFGPIWAMAADRYGRKKVMFLVTGVWGIFTVLAGFAPNYPVLVIVYGISTIGTVASEPILNGLLPDLFKKSERGKAYGLVRGIGGGVGVILGPAVGAFGGDPDGWRYAMWVMGAVSIISGFMILAWVPKPEQTTVSIAKTADSGAFRISDAVKLFRIPTFSLIALMIPLVTSVAVLGFYSTFLVDDRGFSVPEAAVIMAVYNIGVMISSFIGGWLGDFFDRRFGAKGRVMLMQIYLVVFALVIWAVTGLPFDGRIFVYPASLILGLVFSIGFSGCVLPMVSTVVPVQLAATSFAVLFSLIQGGISALFAVFAGTIADAIGLTGTFFWFMTIPYLANAVLWFAFYKTYPKDRAKQEARTAAVYDGAI
jgi:MFS family permease